jgi:hypothetical protein
VGKGALLGLSAWAKSHPRRSPSRTGVNALMAHAATTSEAILPTLPLRSRSIASGARSMLGCVHYLFTFQTAHVSSFPRRVFAPGFCFWLRATPMKGWRSAERRTDACEASVGPALSGQARHLARRLASPYGGRPPPGAHTVAILGFGAALPLTGIAAGSVTANSHVRVVVPGGGPLPPGATVANRRRRTPRLAPPSGCLRTTPFDERGWESI